MGLDCYASIYSDRIFITPEMEAKFDKSFYDGSSFRGTTIDIIINAVTNYSLRYVGSSSVKGIYDELSQFLEKNKEKLEKEFNDKDEIDIRHYVDHYYPDQGYRYFIDSDRLYGVLNFFKVCHENNLYVISDY